MINQILVPAVFLAVILSIFVNRNVVKTEYLAFLDVPYYWSPLIGAVLIWIVSGSGLNQVFTALVGSAGSNLFAVSGHFSTIVLFLSIAFISLCLEVSGFFRFLAVRTLKLVDGSGRRLFFAVFWISGVLALFTSNDILILTFTPFLIEFLGKTDLDAVPFLVAEFFAANVFSMVFLIGNETNIIVATAQNFGFTEFARYMFLPGMFGGVVCFASLYLVFRDRISVEYATEDLPDVKLNEWEVLGSAILVATLVSLAVMSAYGFLLWHVGFIWAFIAAVFFVLPDLLNKRRSDEPAFVFRINDKMPWEVVPFLLGFFLLVQALQFSGLTLILTQMLESFVGDNLFGAVFGVGALSTVSANLLNNIPMTVLFTDVLAGYSSDLTQLAAFYALVIGSNIGANVTPIGALAGIMWMKMVNHEERRISFKQFFRIGWKVTALTAVASLTVLYLVAWIV